MDPSALSRGSRMEEHASGQMPSYIRPLGLVKTFQSLRARMQSALPHLITTAASRALSLRRLRGSWADRACHHLHHTSQWAASVFMQLSRSIAVILLAMPRRRAAVALVEQRGEGSPAPPAALPLGWLIGLVTRQQRPDDPRLLVCDRSCRAGVATALDPLPYPWAPPVRFAAHPAQGRPRAMDEACAQRASAPFAHPQQALLPSRRMLAWPQPQPGGPLPAVFERAGSADGGSQGRRT